jgi:hypothetical protein
MNQIKHQIISRSTTELSLYYIFSDHEIVFSEDEFSLVSPTTKLNVDAVARYLGSDNLVSQAPFSTIFRGLGRIPPGAHTTITGSSIIHQPTNFLTTKSTEKVLPDHFLFPDTNGSLLFSGGLDSSIFLAVNPAVKNLYHLNYHGEGSRTNQIAKKVAEYFGKKIIEINADFNNFSITDYCEALSKGITGIQSPSQYCFNLSLKQALSDSKTEYLVSGQNADTMLYVDHYHAPTQLILHERFMPTARGLMSRHRVWWRTSKSDLEAVKLALSEHMGAPNEIQASIIRAFRGQFKDQYIDLVLPDMPPLAALKLIRWYRGSASVNDNFNLLKRQTGINRIAGLHHTKFLPTSINLVPSAMNLIFTKVELAKLFREVAGIGHRELVTRGILENYRQLSISKSKRAEALNQTSRFNASVVRELFDARRKSIFDLLNELDHPIFIEIFKTVEKKASNLTPEALSLAHRVINLDYYVRLARSTM